MIPQNRKFVYSKIKEASEEEINNFIKQSDFQEIMFERISDSQIEDKEMTILNSIDNLLSKLKNQNSFLTDYRLFVEKHFKNLCESWKDNDFKRIDCEVDLGNITEIYDEFFEKRFNVIDWYIPYRSGVSDCYISEFHEDGYRDIVAGGWEHCFDYGLFWKQYRIYVNEIKIDELEKPIIFSEGKNKEFLFKAKEFFTPNLDYHIYDGGGKNDLKLIFEKHAKNNYPQKRIFVFDSDAIKEFNYCDERKTNYIIPLIFEKNIENTKVTKGIENLFDENLFDKKFYSTKTEQDPYGAKKEIEMFDKNKFLDFICNERDNKEDFIKFKPLFEKISNLLK